TINIASDLTTVGDATFEIDNSSGGMIGADAVMNVSAASISAGGALSANIFNGAGGSIVGGANLSFNLSGDLTTVGDANFTIDNLDRESVVEGNIVEIAALSFNLRGDLTHGGDARFPLDTCTGGIIGSDVVMYVIAASISAGGALSANIFNGAGGSIVGGANLSFNLSGDLTTVGDANFTIDN